jgi:hypothetical protein
LVRINSLIFISHIFRSLFFLITLCTSWNTNCSLKCDNRNFLNFNIQNSLFVLNSSVDNFFQLAWTSVYNFQTKILCFYFYSLALSISKLNEVQYDQGVVYYPGHQLLYSATSGHHEKGKPV